MAVSKVVDIVKRAQTILQDTTATRWPLTELQGWLNDAYKEIVIFRPDANAASAVVTFPAPFTAADCGDVESGNERQPPDPHDRDHRWGIRR